MSARAGPDLSLPSFEMSAAPGSMRDFELWRWAVSPLYEMDALTPDGRPAFEMKSRGFSYSDMPVSTFRSSGSRFERSNRVIAKAGLRRLMRVHQSISDPALFHETIAALAAPWGFADKTVLSRAYKALYGVSPSEARALARTRTGEAGQAEARVSGSFWEVSRWLRGLETPALGHDSAGNPA